MLIEKILFYLLVFCLPFQTRKMIYQWGDGFNEWTSAYLYLTDILLILILLFWVWRVRKQRFLRQTQDKIKNPSFWLVIFLLISLISLIEARNIQLGFYAWLKLLEMAGLFFYLKYNFKQLFNLPRLSQVLVVSGLFQSLLVLGQFFNQKSLGLWFLTESPLDPTLAGVAKITAGNLSLIRAYGGLPHPNLLAGFLILAIFSLYFLWLNREHFLIKNSFFFFVFGLLFFALGLTFSRAIMAVFLLASLIYFTISFKQFRKRIFIPLLCLVILSSAFAFLFWSEVSSRFQISLDEQAVSLRSFYNQTALEIIKDQSWLGLGLGNFVNEINQMLDLLPAWADQPVHNLYLLIAAETGLISLIIFLFFIIRLLIQGFKKIPAHLLIILFCFLIIGLFDHFFWTLQQGQLMFWLVLGIMAGHFFHSLTAE